MPYWIHRNGENHGPYELDQLQQLYTSGSLTAEDLAIEEGGSAWTTVGEITNAGLEPKLGLPDLPTTPTNEATPAIEADLDIAPNAEPAAVTSTGKSKLPMVLGIIIGVTALGAGGYFGYEYFFNQPDTSPNKKYTKNKGAKGSGEENGGNNTPNPTDPGKGGSGTATTDTNRTDIGENPFGPGPNLPGGETNSTAPAPVDPPIVEPPPIDPPVVEPPVIGGGPKPRAIPNGAKYIPADAIAAFEISPKQILDKLGGLDGLMTQMMGPNAEESLPPIAKTALNMLSPANLGMAVDQPIYLFLKKPAGGLLQEPPLVGLVLPVTDSDKFAETITLTATALSLPRLEAKDMGGFKGITGPGLPMPLLVGMAPDAAVILTEFEMNPNGLGGPPGEDAPPDSGFDQSGDENECDVNLQANAEVQEKVIKNLMPAMKIILDKNASLIQARPQFGEVQKISLDGGAWINLTEILKFFASQEPGLPADSLDEMGNVDLAIGALFGQGQVIVKSKIFYDEKLVPNLSNGKPTEKALIDSLPGNAIVALAISANADAIGKFLQTQVPDEARQEIQLVLQSMGLTWDDALNIPGDDFALTLTGIKVGAGVAPMPEFVMGLTLQNVDAVNKLINFLGENNQLAEANAQGLEIFVVDNRLYICSTKFRPQIELGLAPEPPMAPQAQKLLEQNDAALHVNPDKLVELSNLLPPGEVPPVIVDFLRENLNNTAAIHVTANVEPGAVGAQFSVTLKDRSENFLKVVLREAMKGAQGGGFPDGPGGDFPGNPGEGFPVDPGVEVPKLPEPIDERPDLPSPPEPSPFNPGGNTPPSTPPAPEPAPNGKTPLSPDNAPTVPEINPFEKEG